MSDRFLILSTPRVNAILIQRTVGVLMAQRAKVSQDVLSLFSASPCFELMMNVPKAFASLESIPHLNSFVFFGVSVKNKLLTAFKVRPRDE